MNSPKSQQMPYFRNFNGFRTASRHSPQEWVLSHRKAGEVAWVVGDHPEGRLYASSSSNDLLNLIKRVNSNICEILCDYPKRVYFDIDAKGVKLNLCEVKSVIGKYFPNQRLAVSGSYEDIKTSFHITLPDMVITSPDDLERMKALAKHMRETECEHIDDKVYTKNRVMKCIHQSKKDRAKQEILELDDERLHFIGSFLTGNEQPLNIENEEDIHQQQASKIPLQKTKEGKIITYDLPQNFSAEQLDDARYLLNMCPINENTPHSFVWKIANFCYNNGLTFDDFWNWAKTKNDNAQRRNKWLSYHWSRLAGSDFKFSRGGLCSLLSLYYPELKGSIDKTDYITRKFFQTFDLGNATIIDTITPENYKTPEKVLAFSMCMGGGKTTQTIQYLKDTNKNFAWITPRQALVMNTEGRLNTEGIDVVNYLTCGSNKTKKIQNINDASKLLIQAESLHYINDPTKYEVVVIDEIESVLNGWISSTHDKNIAGNWYVFINLLKNAKRVILLDAFLTTKVFNLLKNLNITDIKIYKSNKLPPRLVLKNNTSYEDTIKKIAEDLDAGRKCYVFHAFKSATGKHYSVEQIKSRLLELCNTKPVIKVYHGDADDTTKKSLYNVNEEWKNAHCIITTTAITIGVNYEGLDFDKRYIFISGMVNNPRDVIQSSMRIRKTKSDIIEVFFFDKCNKDTIKLPSYYNQPETDKVYRSLIDEIVQEIQANFYDTFMRFCAMTNYNADDITKKTSRDKFKNDLFASRMLIAYEDVPKITGKEANDIAVNRVWLGKATMLDKFSVSRFHFDNRFCMLDYAQREYLWDTRYESVIDTLNHSLIRMILKDNNSASIDQINWNKLKISDETNNLIDEMFQMNIKNKEQKAIKAINNLCGTHLIECVKPYKTSNRSVYDLSNDADVILEIYEIVKAYNEKKISEEADDFDFIGA